MTAAPPNATQLEPQLEGLPIVLLGAAVRALVVGGGQVAARKASALLEAGAEVLLVTTHVGEGVASLARRHSRLRIEAREVQDGDYGGRTLVVAATDQRSTNAAVARAARERGLLVNVADAPDEGNFVTPAVHRAGALTIAVSAGGVPAAAARIRDEIARRFDERYARAIGMLRVVRRNSLEGDDRDWGAASSALIDEDFCTRVESGDLERRMREWP